MNAFVIFCLLLSCNAILALLEMSLAASKTMRLQAMAEDGNNNAHKAIALLKKPTLFLGASQLGLNGVTLLSGIYVEEGFSPVIENIARSLVSDHLAHIVATPIAIGLVTMLFLLFGDILPKRIGMLFPEKIACATIPLYQLLVKLTMPFVSIIDMISHTILSRMFKNVPNSEDVTTEELRWLVEHGAEQGTVDQSAANIVENALGLDERSILSIMTPRSEVVFLNIEDSIETLIDVIKTKHYHRFIVCKGNLDHSLGLFDICHALPAIAGQETLDVYQNLETLHYIPESQSLRQALEDLHSHQKNMALVINEFGEVTGTIRIQDIYTAVMQPIEHTLDTSFSEIQKDRWFISGEGDIDTLLAKLMIDMVLPDAQNRPYHTVNGFIMYMMGRIPKEGDTFDWGGWHFEVADIDKHFVDKVIATKNNAA